MKQILRENRVLFGLEQLNLKDNLTLVSAGGTRETDTNLNLVNSNIYTLDIDGNGIVELQDYNLIELYAAQLDEVELDFLLNNFPNDLIGENATRTDAVSILAHFETISVETGDITPPLLNISLTDDTGDSDQDSITSNPTVSGTVLDDSGISALELTIPQISATTFDVTAEVNGDGSFVFERSFIESLIGTSLEDGDYTFELVATDGLGNVSDLVEVGFTLDTASPTVTTVPSGTLTETFSSLTVSFSEAVTQNGFEVGNYSLVDEDNNVVAIASVESLDASTAQLNLTETLADGDYQLVVDGVIADLAGNFLEGESTFNFTIQDPVSIEDISPANGEEFVSLTRETIVRFDGKIDPTTVNDDSFYLIANGDRIPGNMIVSKSEEFATFFYDQPLPSSTEIRVVVDGDKSTNKNGTAIDADNNGISGGIATADFRTLPLTGIQGTNVFGYIYDSNYTNPDGSNIPIEGVRLEVDGLTDVFAVTDENGYFILEDVPAPEFFVHIDPSNATSDVITQAGHFYGPITKPFHSVARHEIQLEMDGEPFDVFLPLLSSGDYTPLNPTEETTVGVV